MKVKTKMLYGFIGMGEAGLYGIIGTFGIFFLTTVVGINPAVAGTITAIGAVWETLCGAVIGYVSDNTVTKYGKRKPYILIASIPLMVFTSLFFTNIGLEHGLAPVYYGFMLVMFWTSYAVFYVPYLSWGAELTQDYDERTALRGYAYFFCTIGMAIGLVLPNIVVDKLMAAGISLSGGWMVTGIACGVICGIAIFVGGATIKDQNEIEYKRTFAKKSKAKKGTSKISKENRDSIIKTLYSKTIDMLKNYFDILRLKTAICIIGASVFYLIAYAMFSSVRMYYFTFNLEMSANIITIVMLFLTFASVAFVPFIGPACKLTDKRTTFIIGMAISIVIMGGLGLLGVNTAFEIVVFSIGYSLGSIAYWQLVPSMIYDVCEVDELVNNKRRGGLVISLQSLSESIANAVGLQIVGLILNFSGFIGEAAVQTDRALFWINMSFSVIPAIFMTASLICIMKYPVTKKMYTAVVGALKERESGKDIDMKDFKVL